MSEREPVTVKEYERRNGDAINDVQKLNWTVILFLVLQTTGAVWWAATTHSTLSFVQQSLVELKTDLKVATSNKYSTIDADRDRAYLVERLGQLQTRVATLESAVFKKEVRR